MHEEELLIEKLRKGDEKAFRLLYDRHYVLLCRFANQILNNAALAEEVVDDVIFYLWEHRQEVEIHYSIRAYLMRALRNRYSHNTIVKNFVCRLFCHRKVWIFSIPFLWTTSNHWGCFWNRSLKMN